MATSTTDKKAVKSMMFFGWLRTAIIIVALVAGIVLMVMDILLLTGDSRTSNPAVVGVSLACALIIIAFTLLMLFNSRYCFNDEGIKVVFFVFVDKIKYDDIDQIKQNSINKEISLHFVGKDEKGSVVTLNLTEKETDKVLNILRDKCNVMVETYTPEKKKK